MIYLDHNASTPIDARVFEAMEPMLRATGNAASATHAAGRQLATAVETARRQLAELINADPQELVWTSGATESCNLAIKGIARRYGGRGRHIITQATEHPAVLETCQSLGRAGFEITVLPVDDRGQIDPRDLDAVIRPETLLVSIMHANNETGTLQPLEAISAICRRHGVWFHCDAAQTVGRLPWDVRRVRVDLLSGTAHKMYGPPGAGFLFVRQRGRAVRIAPEIHGGGHEQGLRSGTLNVPAIVGCGAAAALCATQLATDHVEQSALIERLWDGLRKGLRQLIRHGHPTDRLPNTLLVSFPGLESHALMEQVPELACSSGSACSSATRGPSHVLRAMRVPEAQLYDSIRFSVGRTTTAEDIDTAVAHLTAAARQMPVGTERTSEGRPGSR